MTDPHPPAAVLWDLDGTIIDSEPLWLRAESEMLAAYGIEFAEDTRRKLIGSGLWDAAEVFRSVGVPLAADDIVQRWADRVSELYDECRPVWRPGARELLAGLRAADVPCVLVTMSTRQIAERAVRLLPAGTFAGLVTGDAVARPKPHPDPYLAGARLAGAAIADCVAIEDSATGLRAAADSGAVAIGVEHLVPLGGSAAHVLAASLAGIDAATLGEWWRRFRGSPPRPGGHLDVRAVGTAAPASAPSAGSTAASGSADGASA